MEDEEKLLLLATLSLGNFEGSVFFYAVLRNQAEEAVKAISPRVVIGPWRVFDGALAVNVFPNRFPIIGRGCSITLFAMCLGKMRTVVSTYCSSEDEQNCRVVSCDVNAFHGGDTSCGFICHCVPCG